MVTKEELSTIIASRVRRGIAEGVADAQAKGLAEGRAEGIDILESLGVSSDLIEKARKIAAESASSPTK